MIDFTQDLPPAPTVDDLTTANQLPEASRPPSLVPTFGENPWEVDQREKDAADAEFRQTAQAKLDQVALDPDSYFAGKDLGFTRDPKKSQAMALNSAFMEFASGDMPIPLGESDINRRLIRQDLAIRLFEGRGADTEEAFHGEIVKAAQGRKDTDDLFQKLTETSQLAVTAGSVGEAATTFKAWRDEAKAKPGYKPENDADYLEAWHQTQREARERIEPFREELASVWQAMKGGGAGTASELIKSAGADLLLAGGSDGEDTVDEFAKKDAGAVAFEVYQKLSEAEREEFMAGLDTLVKTFPKEERPAVLANLAKSGGRMVDDLARGAASRFSVKGLEQYLNQGIADSAGPLGASDADKAAAAANATNIQADRLAQKNFADGIRKIERGEYAPVRHFSKPSKDVFSKRTLEDGFYGVPGVFASVATAMLPGVGPGAMYLAMEDFAYGDLRDNAMRAGMSDEAASLFADEWKSAAAIPQTALEVLQIYVPLGKLPAVNKVLGAMGDRITNRLLRGVVKAGSIGAAETAVEELQYLTPYAVQEIAHSFAADTGTPPAVWHNGQNGAFDGFWTRQATTFISMLPMAAFGAVGGLNAEARAKAFSTATPLQRRAFGITDAHSAAIDAAAAQGPSSLNAAVEAAMAERVPESEQAKAAVAELEAEIAEQQAAVAEAQAAGVMPLFVRAPGSKMISVLDGTTREEIGQAATHADALRIAADHTNAIDLTNADQVAFLSTLLQAAQITTISDGETRQTGFDVGAGRLVTASEEAALSPADEARVLAQSKAKEAIGGKPGFVEIVLGKSVTRTKQKVRETVNRINAGGSVLTIFHEESHGFFREALTNGRLTKESTIETIRGLQSSFVGKTTKDGEAISFLPAEGEVTDEQLDEAVSELMETLILKNRKTNGMPRGMVSNNLSAMARMNGGAKSFKAFVDTVRDFFGVTFSRVYELKKAIKDGKVTEADLDAFTNKLFGLDAQDEHDAAAVTARDEILGEGDPFSIRPQSLKMQPPKGITANTTESLPTWTIPQEKGVSLPKVLSTAKARAVFYKRLDGALKWLNENPARITTASGWVKFLQKAGVWGEVPMPPMGLAEIINNPAAYVAKLNGGYHEESTLPGTQESARAGLDGTTEMRGLIGAGKAPAPFVVALHHMWGILSRMLPPLHQEGMWLRLISHRPVLDAIQASIDGTFSVSISEWQTLVQGARDTTADGAGQIGNAATANANSFFMMLDRLNGRWQDMADVYMAPNSREMGRRFWDIDAGALGIKNKVQRFIGLTFGIPGVIMDRWKFVEFWLPLAMEGKGNETSADYFTYGNNTPSDPSGIYGVYGKVDSSNEALSLAMYEAFETVLESAIAKSPELQAHLGAHANPGGMHWHGWNAIKNEAVGHSSLDLTKELIQSFGVDVTAETVHNAIRNGTYYTEGAESQQSNVKFFLDRGTVRVERTSVAGGLQPGRAGILGRGTGAGDETGGGGERGPQGEQGQVEELGSFSLGPARMAEALQDNAVNRVYADPRARSVVFNVMMKKLGDLKRDRDEIGISFGKGYKRKAIEDPRKTASINKESAFREAARRAELEEIAAAKYGEILNDDDLVKIKAQPVHEMLSVKRADGKVDTLRGRLMSPTAAAARGETFFDAGKHGDYDGASNIARTNFGGTLLPDQAAQELFDAGLIQSPTPDAMWQAMEREQNSVAKFKEYLKAAQEDLKAARVQAKAEAAKWKAERLKEEKANYSPKARLLRALALLDGIISSLPISERGRIGGYTQLAKLETDEVRLRFLNERIDKVDEVLEKYLVKEYGRMLDKLLERSIPKKGAAGEKPKGSAGAEIHEIFAVLRQAREGTQDEVDAHVDGLLSVVASGNQTAAEVARMTMQANLVGLVGNWKEADSVRRAAAVVNATNAFESGYSRFRLALLLKQEDQTIRRRSLAASTKAAGTAAARDLKMIADNGLKGTWKDNFLSLISFEQLNEYLFGRDSQEARAIVDGERLASNQKEDVIQAKMDALDDLFADLGGSQLAGEKLRWDLSQKNLTVGGRTLSAFEAITATLMWRQEDGRRHMEGHKDENGNFAGPWHYDQGFVDACEAALSDDAKAVRLHIADQYTGEYATLNPVYKALNGINLPSNPNYSPLTVKPVQAAGGQGIDPVTGSTMSGASMTPGSLRTRGQAIAEPDFRDALQTYIAHTKQIQHWIAYAPFMDDVGAILRNRELGNSIEEKGGAQALSVLRSWLDLFMAGGVRDASAHLALNGMMNRMMGRTASAVLVGRMSVLAIQTTQLGAALAEMPTGSFAVRFGKLFTGQLGWGAAFRSEYIQRRLAQMPASVQQAMAGLKASRPNRVKHWVQKAGLLISGTDALMTAGTFAMVHDYQLGQAKALGLTGPEADAYALAAAERAVDRIAQPTRPGTRSLFENTATNPAMRVLWAFASESRQKLALSLWRVAAKDRTLGEKTRALAVTWVVGGMLATVMRAAMRDIKDDGDDDEIFDERNWGAKRLALSSLTGPFGGIPFIGDMLEGGVYALAGERLPEGNLLSSMSSAFKAATRATDWGDQPPNRIMRDVETILGGMAFMNDTLSAAASLSHLARDLFGVAANLADD